MTISQEDALRAIALLVRFTDREAGLECGAVTLGNDALEFLYDDNGDMRFEERDYDPSPNCRCEECPITGPFTCVSED